MLGIARGLQGIGAAAAMVVAIAVVGDLFSESAAATVLSRLMLVLGVAPVVAPSLGAAVLLHALVALGVRRAGGAGRCAVAGGRAGAAGDAAARRIAGRCRCAASWPPTANCCAT